MASDQKDKRCRENRHPVDELQLSALFTGQMVSRVWPLAFGASLLLA